MKKALVIILFGLIIFLSCSKDNGGSGGGGGGGTTVNCATVTNKAFNADILPILLSTCATSTTCHATGSTNGPGPLTNHAQASANGAAIKSAIQSGRMPQTGSLTTGQKNSISCWVDSGAPNN
ncbi:MAG: hypothetical protein E6H07_14730 [Bacteroidetes bacterium]|nr:MAG: hypothetical protein E6H07_14730 [Bacteroidota bacterium]